MLDKFIANVGEERLDGPEGPRPDLLPGHGPRLDRRARGDARRGAPDHRRRLPEPDRRDPRASRTRSSTPTRPSSTRSTRSSSTSSQFDDWQNYSVLVAARSAACRGRRPRGAAGLSDVPDAGPHPGPIATPSLPSIDAALEPDTADKYIYFVAIPDGGGEARIRQDREGARREPEEVRLHPMTGWPDRGGLRARCPTPADHARWAEADRAARPARLARLRERFADAGVDAYFGVRREHMRYLTGFTLGEGEEKVAGNSGQFLVGAEDVAVLADSRYTIQARREAPDAARRRGLQRPAGALARADGVGRGPPRGGRGRLRLARGRGGASRRQPRTWSSSRSRAGSRPTGRSRSRPRSSGSPPPVPSPTGRSPRCSPRSGRAPPRPTSRSVSSG